MSLRFAWQVSDEDISAVLARHNRHDLVHDESRLAQILTLVQAEGDRIANAALYYTTMDDQSESALDEIEDVLIEQGVLRAPKRFAAPR